MGFDEVLCACLWNKDFCFWFWFYETTKIIIENVNKNIYLQRATPIVSYTFFWREYALRKAHVMQNHYPVSIVHHNGRS